MIFPKENADIITTISIKILSIKTGIVIFVGKAARFTTSVIAMATVAVINKARFIPVNATIETAKGVRKHACPANDKPSHNKRLFCWPEVHAEKRLTKDVFAL